MSHETAYGLLGIYGARFGAGVGGVCVRKGKSNTTFLLRLIYTSACVFICFRRLP